MGIEDREILGSIYIHHINPITIDDILNDDPILYDPENLICVSYDTHQQIHYGGGNPPEQNFIERRRNDTSPWRY